MAISKDGETPNMLATLVHSNHPAASFRLDMVRAMLHQLTTEMRVLGFPNAAQVLHLAEAAVADATAVATALDVEIARRLAVAEARAKAEDISPAAAWVDIGPGEQDPADAALDKSRSNLAMAAIEDAAAELDAEGRQ